MTTAHQAFNTHPHHAAAQTEELQRAFATFNQVSAELTQAYAALEQRASSLTEELAVANGELRRQFQEKEALSERLGLLLNALPAGVVVLDGAAMVTQANPAALQFFGEDVVGRHWGDVAKDFLEPTMTLGEWLLGPRRLSVAESPLDSTGGKLLLVHDISLAHQMKAELERSQRLAAMGEMAASLAHQIRTPLAAALLYSANLSQADLPEAARQKFAEKTTAQLRRLERLIQDTLLFARGESIGRDVFLASDWLQEVAQTMEPLARERGVVFQFSDASSQAVLVGARKSLYGALLNLLENALHICESGAHVWLTASRDGDCLQLSVLDEGPGVPPEMRARIFEPFFTTRGLGTGLGLPIALGVARAHGGNIVLRSGTSGLQGAEFVMTLPVAAQDLLDNADNQSDVFGSGRMREGF
ncbi:MAG: hypothetical protein RIR18_2289 [Pseudomonadota bacterium]|jgi:two-component system sensor histidine kinase FlrB